MEEDDDDLYGTANTALQNAGSANQGGNAQMKAGAGEDEEVVEVEEEEEDEVRYSYLVSGNDDQIDRIIG